MEGQPPATSYRSLSQSFWAAVSYFQGFFGNTLSTEAQPEETEQQAEDVSSTVGEEAVSTECCLIGEQEVTEVAETVGASCHGDTAVCRVNVPVDQEAPESSVSPNTEEKEEENNPSQEDTECLVTAKGRFNRRHRPATRRRHEDQTGKAKKVFAQEFGEWTNSKAALLDQACAPQKKTAQGYVGWDTQQEFEVKEKTTVVATASHPLEDLPKPSSMTAWSSALENSKDEEADKAELKRTYATQVTTEVLQLTITQEYASPKEPQESMCRGKVMTGSEQLTEFRSSMKEDLLEDTHTNQTDAPSVEKLTNRVPSLGQSVQLCSTSQSAGEEELEMLTQEEQLGQHVEPKESTLEERQAVQGTLDLDSQSTNEVKPSFNVSPKKSPIQPSITRAGAFREHPKSSKSPKVATSSEEVINEMALAKPEEQCKALNTFTQLSALYPPHLELTAQAEHLQTSEMKEESAQPIDLEDPAGSVKLVVQSVTPEELNAGKLSEPSKSETLPSLKAEAQNAGPEDASTTFLMAAGLHSQSEDSSLNLHQEVPEKVKTPDKHKNIKSSYSDECSGASGPQVHLAGLEVPSLVEHREADLPSDGLDAAGPFEAIKKPIHHVGLEESTIGTFYPGTLGMEASEEHPEDPSTDAPLSLIVSSQECPEELVTEVSSDERPKTLREAKTTAQHMEAVEPPSEQHLEASQNEIPQLLKVSSLMCQEIREVVTSQYPKNPMASTLPEEQIEISSKMIPQTLLDTEKEEVEGSSSGQCPETSEAKIQQAKSQDSVLKHLSGTSEIEIAFCEASVKCLEEAEAVVHHTKPNEPCPEKHPGTSKLTRTEGLLKEPSCGQHVTSDGTGPGAPPQDVSLTETVGQKHSESEKPSPGEYPEEPKTAEQNGLHSEMCPEDLELGEIAGQHSGLPSPEKCPQDEDQGTQVDKSGISNLQQHPESVTAGIGQRFQCAELDEPINKKHPTALETSNQLKKLEELPKSIERRPPYSFTVISEDDSDIIRGRADQDGEEEKPSLGESPKASGTEVIYHFDQDLEIFPKVSQAEEFEEPNVEGQTKPSDRVSQPLDGQTSSQSSGLASTASPVIETNAQCPEISESWLSEPEKSLLEERFELSDKATSLLLDSERHSEITEIVVHKPEDCPGVSDVSEMVPQYGESEEPPSADGTMASKTESQPENLEESALQKGLDISDTTAVSSGVLVLSEYSEEKKNTVQDAEKVKPSPEVCPKTSMKNTQLEDLEESVLHLHQDVLETSATGTMPFIELYSEVRHIKDQHSQLDEPSLEKCPELQEISDAVHIVSEELPSVERPEAFQRETQIVKFDPPVLQEHNGDSLPVLSSSQPFSVEDLRVQEEATQPSKTAKPSSEEWHKLLEISQSAHTTSGEPSSGCSQKQNEAEKFEQSVSQEHMEASPSAVSASSELSPVEDQLVPATPDQAGQHIKPEEPSSDEHLEFSEVPQLGPVEPEGLSSVECPEASPREALTVNFEYSVSQEHSKASPSVVSPPCECPGVPGMVTQNLEAEGTNTSDELTKPEEPSSIKYSEGDTSAQSAGQEESSSEDNSAVASEESRTKDSESKEASRKEYPHYNQVTQHEESAVMTETAKSSTPKAETVQFNHTEARETLTFEDHQLIGDVFDDHPEAPKSLIRSDIPDFLAAECSSDLSRATAMWYDDYGNPGNEAKMDTEEEENQDADICKCEDDQSLKGNVPTEKNLELEEKEVCKEDSGFSKNKPKVLTARRCFSAGDELSAWDKEEMDAAFDDYSKDNVEWEIDKIWLSLHQKSDGSHCQLDSDDEQDDDDSDDDDEMSEDNEESDDKIWLSLHQKSERSHCQLDFDGGQEEELDDWSLQEDHFQQLNNYAMQKARNMLYSIEEEEETELDEEISQSDKHLGAGADVIMKDLTTPPQKENERVSTGAEMEEDERFSKAKEERDQVGLQIKNKDEWDMTPSAPLSLEESRPKGQELNIPTVDLDTAIMLSRTEEIQECPQEEIFPVSVPEDLKFKESVQILNFMCGKSDLLGGDKEEDGSTVPMMQVETPSFCSGASHIDHAVDGEQLQKYEEQAEGDHEKLLMEMKQEAPCDYQEDAHCLLALDDKSNLTASEAVKVIDDSTQRPKEILEIKVSTETLEETDGDQVKATDKSIAFVLSEERDSMGLQVKNEDEMGMSTEKTSGLLHLEESQPKGQEHNTPTEDPESAILLSRTEEIRECPQEEMFPVSVSEDLNLKESVQILNFSCGRSDLLGGDKEEDGSTVPMMQVVETPSSCSGASHIDHAVDGAQLQKYEEQGDGDREKLLVETKQEAPCDYQEDTHCLLALDDKSKSTASEEVKVIDDSIQRSKEILEIKVSTETLEETDGDQVKATDKSIAFALSEERDSVGLQVKNEDEMGMSTETTSGHLEEFQRNGQELNTSTEDPESAILLSRTEEIQECPQEEIFSVSVSKDATARLSLLSEQENESSPPCIKSADSAGSEGEEDMLKKGEGVLLPSVENEDTTPDVPSHTASQSASLHEDQHEDQQESENDDVDLQTNVSNHLLLKETVEPGEDWDGLERLGDKDKGLLVRNEEATIDYLRALETHEEENLGTSKINEDENHGVVEGNKEGDQDGPKGSGDETWNASETTGKVHPCMSLEREELDEFVVERTDKIRVKDEDVLEINKEEDQGIVERIDDQNHDVSDVTTEGHQGTSFEREGHDEIAFKRVDDTKVKDQSVLEINEEECEGAPQRGEDEGDKASDVSDKECLCVPLESDDHDEFVFKRIEEVNQGLLECNEKGDQDHPETHEMKVCGISVNKEKGNRGLGERIGRDGESVVLEYTNDLENVTSGITYGDNEGVLQLSEDRWEAPEKKENTEENVAAVVSAVDQSELGLNKVEDKGALERTVRESWETSEILQQEDTSPLEGHPGQDQRVSENILVENKALGHFEREAWAESRGEELQSEERAEDEKQVYLEVMKDVSPSSNLEKAVSQGIMERTEERHEEDSEKSKEEEKHESDRNDKGDLHVSVADEGVIEIRIEKNGEELEIQDRTTTADPEQVEDRIVSQLSDNRHKGVMERNEEDDTRSLDIVKEEDEELSEKREVEEAILLGNSERGGKDVRKSMEIEGADGENQVISDVVNERGQRAAGTIKECVLEREEGGDQVVTEINEEECQGMPRNKEEEGQDVPERKMEEYQAVVERKKEKSEDEVIRNEEECQGVEERNEDECHDVVERKMEEYYGSSVGKQEEGQVKDMDIVENKQADLCVSESFEEKPQESFERIQEDTNVDNGSQWAYQKMDLDGSSLSEKREKNEESSSKIIDAGDGSSTKTLQTDLEKTVQEKSGSKAESIFVLKRKETNEEETDGVSKISRTVGHDVTLITLEEEQEAEKVKEMKDEGASKGELKECLIKRNGVKDQGASESTEDEVEGTSGNLAAERQDEPVVAGEETKSVKEHLKQWDFITSREFQSPGQGGDSPDTGVSQNSEASHGTTNGTEKKMKSGKVQQLLLQLGGQPGFQPPMFSPKGGLATGRHSAPVKKIMKESGGLGNEEEAKPTRRKLVLPVRNLESPEPETTTKEDMQGGPQAGGDVSPLGSVQLGPQLLDLSAQKSRIALRNKQCRPPQDPKEILKKPSLAPSPVKLPRPEGIGGVPLPFMLPGLGAGPPVLRKRETAPASIKQEPLVTMEVEQPKLGPQLLDLSAQKSRIALRNKQCRPPQDPKEILKKPSLDPTPVKLPRPEGIGGVPLPFMLPGLGAGPPVLRKRETAPASIKQEPLVTMEVEQPKLGPQLLDLSVQKSRIALRNKQCRPPQDPKEILKKPSLDPSPVKLPRPEGIGGVPLPFMLPGLGAGPPVLRKRETAPVCIKREPVATMEVEQPKVLPENQSDQGLETPPKKEVKPKWTPPGKVGFGMAHPQMMLELRGKLKKTTD
ncbi:uncharacterized protein si:ch211-136m16.8 isoform X2 [Polypterus senegalus]|uniref:uncharacterized protein si:ch211-136m16.8 isoform X2 n=1 Tax=Polypterus senegalus TaxID=55291 RepID=UPI001966BBE2|nr:uncharacterized protein si:ch211-136m16.8 isoform X2 [Polypterus senegalus]